MSNVLVYDDDDGFVKDKDVKYFSVGWRRIALLEIKMSNVWV
jgi:hypothetical protein